MSDEEAQTPENEPITEEHTSETGTRGFDEGTRRSLPPGSALSLLWWRETNER